MGDYIRSTKECSLKMMHPELAAAIRNIYEKEELGDIEQSAILCVETTNQKKKRGLLNGPAPLQRVGAVLTPAHLVWVILDLQEGLNGFIAKLKDIEVKEYSSSLIPDTGLDIFGWVNHSYERVSVFLGLGSEPAGKKFSEAVRQAAAQSKA